MINKNSTVPFDRNRAIEERAREQTRRMIVRIGLGGLLLQFPMAVVVAKLSVLPWDHVEDVLDMAVAPIAGIAAAIGFSYFK
ncbi:MAG: hypothetical protein ACLP0J_26945 [Solirubrobacteraceae bacterium]